MTLNVQFLTMIFMVLGGYFLGISLTTFRRFSPYWRGNTFFVYFIEICFWVTQTFLLFYILYRVNAGELRIYVFIACLLGFSIYQVTTARLYKVLLEQIIRVFLVIYRFFKAIVQALIITPIRWILYAFLTVVQLIISLLLYIIKLVLAPVKWILKGIYFVLPKEIQKIIGKFIGLYSIIKIRCIKWVKYIVSKRR